MESLDIKQQSSKGNEEDGILQFAPPVKSIGRKQSSNNVPTANKPDWRYLTDCQYFMNGSCRLDNCTYRHCEDAKYAYVDCRYWNTYTCTNIRCPFKHAGAMSPRAAYHHDTGAKAAANSSFVRSSESGKVTSTAGVTAASRLNEELPVAMCAFFMRGKCTKGDSCRYAHDRAVLPSSGPSGCISTPTTTMYDTIKEKAVGETEKVGVGGDLTLSTDGEMTAVTCSNDGSCGSGSTSGVHAKRKAADILLKHSFKKNIRSTSTSTTSISNKRRDIRSISTTGTTMNTVTEKEGLSLLPHGAMPLEESKQDDEKYDLRC